MKLQRSDLECLQRIFALLLEFVLQLLSMLLAHIVAAMLARRGEVKTAKSFWDHVGGDVGDGGRVDFQHDWVTIRLHQHLLTFIFGEERLQVG